MTKADQNTIRKYDRWLDDNINGVDSVISIRRRRGKETMINEERRRTLRQCRDALQYFHRQESNR